MLSTSTPMPAFRRTPTPRPTKRPVANGEQAIWIPMLNSASKGKDLTEKQLIVLGGTPDQQKEFLAHLNPENTRSRFNDRRNAKKAPISNRYTLGYTYHDVQDADDEGMLARLNIHMLSNPSASFAPLLKPLLTVRTVKDTLITILLDWSDPTLWARQLRQWIRLLRSVILTLDDDTKIAMEENMTAWKEKRVGPDGPASQPGKNNNDAKTTPIPPLGTGEWDEGLGVPLSIVCVQGEKIETVERDQGWQDEHFDFLMQWLRCVLLKHGASLVYTASFDANHVRTLIHSSLSIHSLLKRAVAKPNFIERDKILIPPNWDSWGKIRPIGEGTDLEAISNTWSIEIQAPPEENPDFASLTLIKQPSTEDSAVSLYEATLPNPSSHLSTLFPPKPNAEEEEITVPSVQDFLSNQFKVLEGLKEDDEKNARKSRKNGTSSTGSTAVDESTNKALSNLKMAEQIGPYQINVNGIDFDAEEATRRLRERENERSAASAAGRSEPSKTATAIATASGTGSGVSTPTKRPPATASGATGGPGEDTKTSNEAMSAFFANLIKKDKRGGGGGSAAVSPNRGSPAPERRLE